MPGPIPDALADLADTIGSLRWADLPAPVRERARLAALDDLGAAIAGTRTRAARIAAEVARDAYPGTEATLAAGGTASTLGAAFANGVAANAVDVDDVGAYTWGHPGAQLFPAALGVAEAGDRTLDELLTAMVVGYEVAFLTGRCWFADVPPDGDRGGGYRGCGAWGAVACAAVAANLWGLGRDATVEALGIAEYHSPWVPILDAVDAPAMVKHGTGIGPITGILAAQLARRGFTGTPGTFADPRFAPWVGTLGRPFLITEAIQWKDWSCCAWVHPALTALRELTATTPVDPAAIETIEIETYGDAVRLGGRLPGTTEEAQFNVAWPVAAFLRDGEVMPEQILEDRLGDEALRALAARVRLVQAEDLERAYLLEERLDPDGADAARVTVTLTDGRRLTSGTVALDRYADRDRPTMAAKFHRLADPVLGAAAADELVAMLFDPDAAGTARRVAALAAAPD